MTKTTIYAASAGTGKTTTLMDQLEKILEHTPPERVGYTTYTNAGATEAVQRAIERFGFSEDQFPHFRTLHSLCYRNMPRLPMISYPDYKIFGKRLGYAITGMGALSNKDGGASPSARTRGDRLLTLDLLRRSTLKSFEETCEGQLYLPETPTALRHFSESYRLFKDEIGKIDFGDQLERFLAADEPLDIDYLFVDEAQDLSRIQWRIVDLLSRSVKAVYIAGDDKQSIYEFSGGDPESLIQRTGDRLVLGTCYRLPETNLAFAESIAARISRKTPYQVSARSQGGHVQSIQSLKDLDLSQGTWLLLARNRSLLEYYEKEVLAEGYLYKSINSDVLPADLLEAIAAWRTLESGGSVTGAQAKALYAKYLPTGTAVHRGFKKVMAASHDDDEFDYEDLKNEYGLRTAEPWDRIFPVGPQLKARIIAAEKRGDMKDLGRIEITTIHSTKGREADNVVVLPDMTYTTWTGYQDNPDAEHRTFYVAATRARQRLYLHQPLTRDFYEFPRTG